MRGMMIWRLRDRIKIYRQHLSRAGWVQGSIGWLIAQYIRLIYHSSTRIRELPEAAHPYADGSKSCIFAFWHGRLIMIPPNKPPKRPMHVLISQHNDGELIAQASARFDIHTVRGSTSKGGMLAGRDIVKLARKGDNISITPDGPRGPNRKAQAGIIQLARMCDKPIVPISYSTSRHKALKAGIRCRFPCPSGAWPPASANPSISPVIATKPRLSRHGQLWRSVLTN